jgi:ketosteroid isomerase-like protein
MIALSVSESGVTIVLFLRLGEIGMWHQARPAEFVEVYRRQADGSWRCVVDMFSSDEAATCPRPL